MRNLYLLYQEPHLLFFNILFFLFITNTAHGQLVADAGSDTAFCSGLKTTLGGSPTASGGSGDYSYLWTPSGTLDDPTAENPEATPLASITNYIVTVTDNINGTTDKDTVRVELYPLPTVQAYPQSSDTICTGSNLTIGGAPTASGGTPPYDYTWFPGFDLSDAKAANPVASPPVTRPYSLQIEDDNGCFGFDGVTIVVQAPSSIETEPNKTVCENDESFPINASIENTSISNPKGVWSTTGTGTFGEPTDTLTTYAPGAEDIINGNVTLTFTSTDTLYCPSNSDNTVITFAEGAVVVAGSDQSVCASNPNVNLSGSVTGGTNTGKWSASSGKGSFAPNNTSLNATFIPHADDIAAGSVDVILTSTNNGVCDSVTDQLEVTFVPVPVVNAGGNLTVCSNNAETVLSGSISGGATEGIWSTSSGKGSFIPDNTTLDATFIPHSDDIANGSVVVTLTTTDHAPCNQVSDNFSMTFTEKPLVNAGGNKSACFNDPNIVINGSVSGGATTGQWTTSGTGNFNPDATTLTVTYEPSADDIAAGSVVLTLTSTNNGDCLPESDFMTLSFINTTFVEAGADKTVCSNNPDVNLSGSVTGGTTTGNWTTDGDGVFEPNSAFLNAVYKPGANDIANGNVILTLTSTDNAPCSSISDSLNVSIIDGPVVDAGPDQNVCSNNLNISLSGSVSGPTQTGIWSTSGDGTFNPSVTNLSASYTPGSQDIIDGIVTITLTSTSNGSCLAETDVMTINIAQGPVVDAGEDQSLCSSSPDVILNGVVSGSTTTGIWTTTGTGSFNPDDETLNATYIPSAGDISSGTFTLTLTSTNNGTCIEESDAINVTITESPVVNAGSDITQCENNLSVNLSGTVSGGTSTGIWSTDGTGSFDPGNTSLNAKYIPGADDIIAGNVTLTLASTNNGGCLAVSDDLVLAITPAPVVDAGDDQNLSILAPNATLNGSVTGGATEGIWTSTGSGTFNPDNTTMDATYIPSSTDSANAMVTLTLTSLNNGNCVEETDDMMINWSPGAVVNAGPDQEVCESDPDVFLDGSVSVTTNTGVWTTTGTGSFDDSTDLNTTYHLSAADISAGTIVFTLTSTNNGPWDPNSDDMMLTISELPVVDAGSNDIDCANNNIPLNGNISGGTTTGGWSTSGDGTFSPDSTQLDATYVPGSNDRLNGGVTLFLTSTNNGGCNAFTDNKSITLTPAPEVDAGVDQTLCRNNPSTILNGAVGGATLTGVWSASGDGSFLPDANTLDATYEPGTNDLLNGAVVLKLTSTNNGTCSEENDSVLITYTDPPIVNAGSDKSVCANNPDASLNGSVSGASVTGYWTSAGDGTFTPDSSDLNSVYTPGTNDISSGSVYLTLLSTNNGNCIPESDSLLLTIIEAPMVDAGPDQIVSTISPNSSLTGLVTGSTTTGIWTTSGTGNFIPNAEKLDGVYEPGSADTAARTVTLQLTSTNNGKCVAESDEMTINYVEGPVVNAGADQQLCISDNETTMSGYVGGNTTTGMWSTSGTGVFGNNSYLTTTYLLGDEDKTNGSVVLTLTSTNSSPWEPASDSLILYINELPVVDAGDHDTICSNSQSQLAGSVTGGTATGGWTTAGDGAFLPDTTDLNAKYVPGEDDKLAGNVLLYLTSTNNGGCAPVTDDLSIKINQEPTVNAGPDETVCANNSEVTLNGAVSGATTTGIWLSSGDGTFNPDPADLNATYLPGNDDLNNGTVSLTLKSTNNGICNEVTDDITVTITQAPVVNAGPDQSVCANNNALLAGHVTGFTTSGIWTSSGDGSFTPNNTTLNATYTFGNNDKSNGSVELVLTSTNNDNCFAVTDTMIITVTPEPAAFAGNDTSLCSSTPDVPLNGMITGGAGTGQWSTSGNGTFIPTNTNLNAVYQPSQEDILNGTVYLTLTSTNNGGCIPVSDMITVNYQKVAVVDAGDDVYVCSDNLHGELSGSITGGTSTGIWSTTGDGLFDDINDVSTTYYVGNADSASARVDIILTSTNNGLCSAVTDTVILFVSQPSVANAGTGDSVCANNANITLSGSVTGGTTTGTWSSSGNGTFTPDPTTLDAMYSPGNEDKLNGMAVLTLTSTNSGGCDPSADSILIIITSPPVVDAGGDQQVCETTSSINVSGSVTGGSSSGIWSTLGTGSYSPDNELFDVEYTRSSADSAAGFVDLVLTSTNNGECLPESDTARIDFTRLPVVDAGTNDTVCSNNPLVPLNGSVTGGTSSGQWIALGDGTFSPADTLLDASYIPGTLDLGSGNVKLVLTSTNNGGCNPDSDTILIFSIQAPEVDVINNDTMVCIDSPTVTLNGTVDGVTISGIWSSTGDGTFSPNDSILTNVTYSAGESEIDSFAISSSYIYLTSTNNNICNPVSDSVLIMYQPLPLVYAGPDQNFCLSDDSVELSGLIGFGSTTGIWTTSGSGTFENDTALNTHYYPGSVDTANSEVDLFLTTTNNGVCSASMDTVHLNFFDPPVISAGDDMVICENNATIDLRAQLVNDPDGLFSGNWTWQTSGTGRFSDTTVATPRYIPGQEDIENGNFNLILYALDNVPCTTVTDTVNVTVTPEPVVNAGTDQTVCITGDIISLSLSGEVTGGSSTGVWSSTGDGEFPPGDSILVSSYTLGNADNNPGEFDIILTSTNNGHCRPVSDSLTVNVREQIRVDAGDNILACENNNEILLEGSVSGGSTSGEWSTSGNGSFVPSASELNTSYNMSPTDINNGDFWLILSSTNNQGCQSVQDSINIQVSPSPIVDAGEDTTVNTKKVRLNGTVRNAGGGIWTTLGTGSFFPSDTALNVVYNFNVSEMLSGNPVVIILTSTENGSCLPVNDSVQISNIAKSIPNAFTPNDDGYNDIFMEGEQITVFNRWGQLIYEGDEGWDGRFNGEYVSSGTYFYIITYINENGEIQKTNGTVTVVTKEQ